MADEVQPAQDLPTLPPSARKVSSKKDSRCIICQLKELSLYDNEIFYHVMDYNQFTSRIFQYGIKVAEKEFLFHMRDHLYIGQDIPEDSEVDIGMLLKGRIAATSRQLKELEREGATGTPEYSEKTRLLQTQIELEGKFTGAFTQKIELTNDFKALMLKQLTSAVDGEQVVTENSALMIEGSTPSGEKKEESAEEKKEEKDEPDSGNASEVHE